MDFEVGRLVSGPKHGSAAKRIVEHTRQLEKRWHGSTVGGMPANLAETLRPIRQRAVGPRQWPQAT